MGNIDFTKVQVGECDVLYKIRANGVETDHTQDAGWITLAEIKEKIEWKSTPLTFTNARGREVQFGIKMNIDQMPIEQFSDDAIAALDATRGEVVDILLKAPDKKCKKILNASLTYGPEGEVSPMNPLGMKVGFNTVIAGALGDLVKNVEVEW